MTIANDGTYQRSAKIYMRIWKAQNKLSAHTAAVLQGGRDVQWRKKKHVHGQLIFFRQFTPHIKSHTSDTKRGGKERKENN